MITLGTSTETVNTAKICKSATIKYTGTGIVQSAWTAMSCDLTIKEAPAANTADTAAVTDNRSGM